MNALLGVIFHFLGGFASGSFYMPYKKVKGWQWETFWLIGGIFSWIIVPPLAAFLTIPNFWEIIQNESSSILGFTFLFGALWGIGGFMYGLGVRYLGVALGSSIMLGLTMVIGSLLPSIYYEFNPQDGKDNIGLMFSSDWGKMVLLGLLVCVVGIIISGKAGVMKDKELQTDAVDPHGMEVKTEYKFGLGLIVAIISGVLSACFNFGLEAGKPMATIANEAWKVANPNQGEFLFQNNVTYVVVLWGGMLSNLIGCLYLSFKNKSYSDYTKKSVPVAKNIIFCALAGTMWFLQFFFYGMGESKMGNGPSSWILHMAFIILIANLWGVIIKEWKGVSKKTITTISLGMLVMFISILIVGYGNSLR
ncbi:L-rhamnose/proton symporter RhaT [Chryseobacterium formosus]|uniref:L-rhamnose/proton symporter RhaT n=1 Tax=Chryseobacterium formosus TaxID=1537363 RepID=A0ABT3XQ20_9FLAO|nr:L-rhamnose/proton symporter RhaT [Chryseobacterium formosus]MCX8523242.1 L-rhamnose/proton symporter RhaT [Chryseobacterium formosus]